MNMNNIADRIRMAMNEAGLSQKELADACGIKPPSVNGWLSGKAKFLRGENLLKAAKALGVNQEWLASGSGPMRGGVQAPPASLAESLRLKIETAEEMQLLTTYRMADERGRSIIEDAVAIVMNSQRRAAQNEA